MDSFLTPGCWVRHPEQPDWGLGQVQSAIGLTITVTFENAGKRVINAEVISLETATDDDAPPRRAYWQ